MSKHAYPALLIGGVADGKRVFVDGGVRSGRPLTMARYEATDFNRPYHPDEPINLSSGYRQEDYMVADEVGGLLLMAPRGFNRREVLARLVAGYQQERG